MIKNVITIGSIFVAILIFSTAVYGLPPIEGKLFGLTPLTNEISFYKNADDDGNDRGKTLQIVAINSLKLGMEFTFEFTADFNYDMTYQFDMDGDIDGRLEKDHYIELSLVKPVFKCLSVNYQRIYSSFEDKPINQFGLRLSL